MTVQAETLNSYPERAHNCRGVRQHTPLTSVDDWDDKNATPTTAAFSFTASLSDHGIVIVASMAAVLAVATGVALAAVVDAHPNASTAADLAVIGLGVWVLLIVSPALARFLARGVRR